MPKKLIEFFKAGCKGHQSSSVCRTRPGTMSEGGVLLGRFLQQVESAGITRGGLPFIYPWGNSRLNYPHALLFSELAASLYCSGPRCISGQLIPGAQAVACPPARSRGVFGEVVPAMAHGGPESPCSEPGHLSHGATCLLGQEGLNQITTG